MKLNTYKNYRTCINCGINKPLTWNFYPRNNSLGYLKICKDCRTKALIESHWKDGLLKCKICGNYLDVSNFSKNSSKGHRDGRDSRCNKCRSIQSAKNRSKKFGDNAIDRIILERFLGARDRAKRLNIEFSLTKELVREILVKQNYKCAISKIDITFIFGNGRVPTNMSIDRINPKSGYTQENTQIVCMAVNQMKSDLNMNQLIYFCNEIVKNTKYEN